MALPGHWIRQALANGTWQATRDGKPVGADELQIGPNSVNLSLAPIILEVFPLGRSIDLHDPNSFGVREWNCSEGFVLTPGFLFLASVREAFDCSAALNVPTPYNIQYTERQHFGVMMLERFFFPCVEGRSTVARVGLSVHECAGFGDYGFSAPFTLELRATLPVKVYASDHIAQAFFVALEGAPEQRYEGAYAGQNGPTVARLGKDRFQALPRGKEMR